MPSQTVGVGPPFPSRPIRDGTRTGDATTTGDGVGTRSTWSLLVLPESTVVVAMPRLAPPCLGDQSLQVLWDRDLWQLVLWAGVLRRAAPATLVRKDPAVVEELATPDAPRFSSPNGGLEAGSDDGTLGADPLGRCDLAQLLGEEQITGIADGRARSTELPVVVCCGQISKDHGRLDAGGGTGWSGIDVQHGHCSFPCSCWLACGVWFGGGWALGGSGRSGMRARKAEKPLGALLPAASRTDPDVSGRSLPLGVVLLGGMRLEGPETTGGSTENCVGSHGATQTPYAIEARTGGRCCDLHVVRRAVHGKDLGLDGGQTRTVGRLTEPSRPLGGSNREVPSASNVNRISRTTVRGVSEASAESHAGTNVFPDRPPFEMVPRPGVGRVFTGERRVRLGDVDPSGRLRFDALTRYTQDVSNDDTTDVGLADDLAFVVRRTTVDTHQAAIFGEDLIIATFCGRLGRRWAERRLIVTGSLGARYDVATLWVHIDVDSGRPRALNDDFLRHYGEAAQGLTVSARHQLRAPDQVGVEAVREPWPLRSVDFDTFGHMNNAAYWAVIEEHLSRQSATDPSRITIEYGAGIAPEDVVAIAFAGRRRADGEDQEDLLWWEVDGQPAASAAIESLPDGGLMNTTSR